MHLPKRVAPLASLLYLRAAVAREASATQAFLHAFYVQVQRLGRPAGAGGVRTRAQKRAEEGDPPFACLDRWAAIQGSRHDRSQPSTASNYPDVIYVHERSSEAVGLYKTGFATLPMVRQGRLFQVRVQSHVACAIE